VIECCAKRLTDAAQRSPELATHLIEQEYAELEQAMVELFGPFRVVGDDPQTRICGPLSPGAIPCNSRAFGEIVVRELNRAYFLGRVAARSIPVVPDPLSQLRWPSLHGTLEREIETLSRHEAAELAGPRRDHPHTLALGQIIVHLERAKNVVQTIVNRPKQEGGQA